MRHKKQPLVYATTFDGCVVNKCFNFFNLNDLDRRRATLLLLFLLLLLALL